MEQDIVTLVSEPREGEPLLVPVLRQGQPVAALPDLAHARERCAAGLRSLPPALASLDRRVEFRVEVDPSVSRLAEGL
jgi:nicotinate phosphoribosyltransferase